MLQHFSFKPMYENKQLPGGPFLFFTSKPDIVVNIYRMAQSHWTSTSPPTDEEICKENDSRINAISRITNKI